MTAEEILSLFDINWFGLANFRKKKLQEKANPVTNEKITQEL